MSQSQTDPEKEKWIKKFEEATRVKQQLTELDDRLSNLKSRILEDRPIGVTSEQLIKSSAWDPVRDLERRINLLEESLKEPVPEKPKPPEPKRDLKKKPQWAKEAAKFRSQKLLADRLLAAGDSDGRGAEILAAYEKAVKAADDDRFDDALELLAEANRIADEAREQVLNEKNRIAEETRKDSEKQREVFNLIVKTSDVKYGFDVDVDAKYFHLANNVDDLGGLKPSKELLAMADVMKTCAERKLQMQKAGASIDEIVETVYANVPKSLWPDDIVKEVVLYKSVKAEIEVEEQLAEVQDDLEKLSDASETAGTVSDVVEGLSGIPEGIEKVAEKIATTTKVLGVDVPEKLKGAAEKVAEKLKNAEKLGEAMKVIETFTTGFTIANELFGSALKGIEAGEKSRELKEEREKMGGKEANPVKEKILEFERNKAIVECVNKLASLGLDQVSDFVPVLGAIGSGKDMLIEITKAGFYFKNTLNLEKLKKGAKADPRSAALLPLARLAREQKIALSESALNALSNAMQSAGQGMELAVISAPAGLVLDVSGKVLSFGTKVLIQGVKWSDAKEAARCIREAAGPPPLRRAQIEVMKNSSKYAKIAIVHLAMKENDPWAIGHLEAMGLGREDLDHPATTSKLIREYMALKAGGILGDKQDEEQETFGESILGKIGKGIGSLAEKVGNKIVGRDTSIPYDSNWEATETGLVVSQWQATLQEAVEAGWYDTRPNLEAEFVAYSLAITNWNRVDSDKIDQCIEAAATLDAAMGTLRNQLNGVETLANDRKTKHEGMSNYIVRLLSMIDDQQRICHDQKEQYYNAKLFPGLSGEALEQARKEFIDQQVELAKQKQQEKAKARRELIAKLWDNYEFKSPYGKCKLSEFSKLTGKSPLEFTKLQVTEVEQVVKALRESVIDKLAEQLMASADDTVLRENFKPCAMNIESLVVETLRATCQQIYQEANVGTPEVLWQPREEDFVLVPERWREIIDLAKKGGWDQEENTGFTDSLKAFQAARLKFEEESKKTTPNPTVVQQQRGVILGALNEYEGKLKKFKPVTRLKFPHSGLVAYRHGMLDEVAVARTKYEGDFFSE